MWVCCATSVYKLFFILQSVCCWIPISHSLIALEICANMFPYISILPIHIHIIVPKHRSKASRGGGIMPGRYECRSCDVFCGIEESGNQRWTQPSVQWSKQCGMWMYIDILLSIVFAFWMFIYLFLFRTEIWLGRYASNYISTTYYTNNLPNLTNDRSFTDQGPAQCYRRSASTFRNDVGNRSLLCISATSEDPALCANSGIHIICVYVLVNVNIVFFGLFMVCSLCCLDFAF